MSNRPIRSIAIVGGGTAGWMAAASLSKFLKELDLEIHLVESEDIGTVGVGEATIPPIMSFIRSLGINEDELIAACQGTFKLGIEFRDWARLGDRYIHPFGQTGYDVDGVPFFAYWLRAYREGRATRIEDYSLMAMAMERDRFMRPEHNRATLLRGITYALHFDASLFAAYLRRYAEARNVRRIEGKVARVALRPDDGFIDQLILENGQVVAADFFIDCSGFRGLLIEGALETGFDDWSAWLPCDRAVAVASANDGPVSPHTVATARDAGWQWRIPLQHRAGNGYVYCSQFLSQDEAARDLLQRLPGKVLKAPVQLSFTSGRRRKTWNRNCLSLGLASGFLEPLESTSIHLVHRGLAMLLNLFPDRDFDPVNTDQYNRLFAAEYERIRDFLLLHYRTTQRTDSEFWRYCQTLPLTDGLQQRLDLFRSYGRVMREDNELFPVQSWQFVLMGQGVEPLRHDPMADWISPAYADTLLNELRAVAGRCADHMPTHQAYLDSLRLSEMDPLKVVDPSVA